MFMDPGGIAGGAGGADAGGGGGYLSGGVSMPAMMTEGYKSPSVMQGMTSPGPGGPRGPVFQRYVIPPSDPMCLPASSAGNDLSPAGCKTVPEFPWMKDKKASRKDQAGLGPTNHGKSVSYFISRLDESSAGFYVLFSSSFALSDSMNLLIGSQCGVYCLQCRFFGLRN